MSSAQQHVLVIGAGPGGEAAAKAAAQRGARVTVVEKQDVGGLCLNRGCVPSKVLLEAAHHLRRSKELPGSIFGTPAAEIPWNKIIERKNGVVEQLRGALSQNLKRLGVHVEHASARFKDAHTVVLQTAADKKEVKFDTAIIAVGSQPMVPAVFLKFKDEILDSDKALDLALLPRRMLIVGGGAIGCEFACLYQELGCEVTLVEKMDTLLPGEDAGVVRVLQNAFEKRGMKVCVGSSVENLSKGPKGWNVRLSGGAVVEADEILLCVGRRPFLEGLDLASAGIEVVSGKISVNESLRTTQPHIFAVGDVNGMSLLAHAASVQGEIAADNALGASRNYDALIPKCLYTWPEVASVGEGKPSAEKKGLAVKVSRHFFQISAKALASGETDGFIQMVAESGPSGRILGAQIVGPQATELIHVFSTAVAARMTVEQLRRVVFAHPTLSEGIHDVLCR